MPEADSKPVKKEEVEEDEDDKCIASAFAKRSKKSPGNATPKSESKVKKEVKKLKKEEPDDEDFDEPTSNRASNKKIDNRVSTKIKSKKKEEEVKKKGGKAGESNKDVAVKKRGKKVYDLPGQKRDPPEERDPLRIFYETLYKQVPASEMAAVWMMESGLLPKDEAKKVFDRKQKRAQQQKLGSPMKTVTTVKKKAESVTVEKKSAKSPTATQTKKTPDSKVASKQTKKRKSKDDGSSEDDSDDDFVVDKKKSKKQKVS